MKSAALCAASRAWLGSTKFFRVAFILIAQAFTPATLATMRAIKAALDPHGILNPGQSVAGPGTSIRSAANERAATHLRHRVAVLHSA
ncbi:FAD-linked oxidase C-terminal domain-containing protein [Stenotrophomonas sp. ZAC14D2_NAIMI4_6]|uniref:FAD-linked oxidase C-terminal domain-containing protein n=1 Tax=Stenotrophomonas sp. ZAC14D2_NAIMI4_6 TaxID=2072406 RepID=UPI001F2AE44F|nr:FAD-linked oxidase C-terminal domain-containing protein [Stenotrophomonas sp. ZAC14D2_NAIMI4_6]